MPRSPKSQSARGEPKQVKARQTASKREAKPPSSAKAAEEPLLDEYQKRCNAVCDMLHHVIRNDDVTGFYLWGPRGCGKTTGIERALQRLEVTPSRFRGTSSSEGLFSAAKDAPESVLWFNDDPLLLTEKAAQQYLLAMLEGATDPTTGEERRVVTRIRHKKEASEQFEFKGKLIFDSNLPLGQRPVLQAVEDRLRRHHFAPPDPELAAVLLYLSRLEEPDPDDDYSMIRPKKRDWKYWEKTTRTEREEIAKFIITQSLVHKRPLTIRLFRDTLRYFVDQREEDLHTDWRDVVVKEITQFDVQYQHTKPSRKDRLEAERLELRIILEDADELGATTEKNEVQALWMESTEQSQRQFFRRLSELPENIRGIYESLPDARCK